MTFSAENLDSEGVGNKSCVTMTTEKMQGGETLGLVGSIHPDQQKEIGASQAAMQAHFSVWAVLGINYSIINTPLAMGAFLAFVIGVGGSPVYIYGFIVTFIFQLVVCVSLAELASAFPHSTGPPFWTSCVAPKRWARPLSYWCGAFTASAWFFWTMGTYLFTSQFLFALASVATKTFAADLWQVYLGYLAAACVAVFANITLFRYYSGFMSFTVYYFNFVVLCVFITLLVRAHPKRSANTVFVDFVNETGWSSDGLVFLLGLLPGITGINGFDAAAHITDEMPDPARQVPQVMIGTSVLCGVFTIPMTITYMFCVVNEANLLTPIGGQPFAQLFQDSTASYGLAVFFMVLTTFGFFASSCAITTTTSRTIWSLAQRNHMVGSRWLRRISQRHNIPNNAIYFCATLAGLVGLLVLGPSTALNAVLGSAAICFFCAYIIPLACLLANRSPMKVKKRYLNLGGIFGPVLNIFALMWSLLMVVVLCLPQYVPVTPSLMNYAGAVLAGVIIVFTLNWVFFARSRYEDSAIL